MATEQFCNFHMHDWLRKRVENDCVELPRGLLVRVLVMQFQNFMTNHIIFILSMLVSDWLTTFAHAQCGCL